MYSPAEINKAYKLKTTIIYMIPMLLIVLLIMYHPPRILLAITGTTQGVKFHEISDSLHEMNLKFQRLAEISRNQKDQIRNFTARENSFTAISLDGVKFQMRKPQFQSWAEFQKANKGKTFADFREAENSYYKAQIDSIWSQLRKGNEDE